MERIEIFTDGGCSGNPGPGGWAFVLRRGTEEILGSGGEGNTTNNRMELRAVISALEEVERILKAKGEAAAGAAASVGAGPGASAGASAGAASAAGSSGAPVPAAGGREEVELWTDSQYVKNGITSWINSWKRNGWRTADKKPVKNQELWMELDAVAARVKPKFSWIKGHAGHEHNERCDELVQVEIRKQQARRG